MIPLDDEWLENLPNGFWGFAGERTNMLNISVADKSRRGSIEWDNERAHSNRNHQFTHGSNNLTAGLHLLIIMQSREKKPRPHFTLATKCACIPKPIHIHVAKSLLFQIRFWALFNCTDFYENANNYDCCGAAVRRCMHIGMHSPAWNACISGFFVYARSNCIKNFSWKQKGDFTTTLHLNWSNNIRIGKSVFQLMELQFQSVTST